jgi:hypothetical protein
VEVQFHPFSSSALVGVERSASRLVCGTHEERENLMYPKLNSDQVNSFPNPHSSPKVPFTVSIPHILTLTAILGLKNLRTKGNYIYKAIHILQKMQVYMYSKHLQ